MEDRQSRAEARRHRTVMLRSCLGRREPGLVSLRGEEALSLVWPLTRECWALGQLPVPSYPRRDVPCRFVPGRLT